MLDALRALEDAGVESGPLCRAVGIDAATLADSDARVPVGSLIKLFALAERRSRDPWIGLHAGELAECRGPLFYLMASSRWIAEGLSLVLRFSAIGVSTLRVTLRTESATASLIFDPGDPAFASNRHATEYLAMLLVRVLRSAVDEDLPLLEARFRHRRHESHAEPERVFGCPVRFGAPDDRLVLVRASLQREGRFGNRAIAAEIEKFAAALSARLLAGMTHVERVRQVVRVLLAAGRRPEGPLVATKLGMSWRSLQRKLADQKSSFRALRDDVLFETAEALLFNPALKVEAIALSLGFSSTAAFSKAFRRRRGRPPIAFRRRPLRRSPSSAERSGRTMTRPQKAARRAQRRSRVGSDSSA